jgi:PAS domain S-box-containing protein
MALPHEYEQNRQETCIFEASRRRGAARVAEFRMNVHLFSAWKGRLQQAQAILAASPPASEGQAWKALRDAASSLEAAMQSLEGTNRELDNSREEVIAERARYEVLFHGMPVPAVVTSQRGDILELNPAAASFLNTSARGASGKSVLLFFTDERETWLNVIRGLRESEPHQRDVTVRPREKAPKKVLASLRLFSNGTLCWFFLPLAGG